MSRRKTHRLAVASYETFAAESFWQTFHVGATRFSGRPTAVAAAVNHEERVNGGNDAVRS
jgi:hypothetical protein